MTVAELIKALKKFDPNHPVMILDSFNGGGSPRDINLGPKVHVVSEANAADAVDCEEIVGDQVVIVGYGCY